MKKRIKKSLFAALTILLLAGGIFLIIASQKGKNAKMSFQDYFQALLNAAPLTETECLETLEPLFLPVENRIARYAGVYDCSFLQEGTERYELEQRLPEYRGTLVYADTYQWNSIRDQSGVTYLIRETIDKQYSVFKFVSILTDPCSFESIEYPPDCLFGAYRFEDVLTGIYGVTDAEQIQSISFTAENFAATPEGLELQKKIGVKIITSREQIDGFYAIIRNMICYGEQSLGRDDIEVFRQDTVEAMKKAHLDCLAQYRKVTIGLSDGRAIDCLKYSLSWGGFYESFGIVYHDLNDSDAEWIRQMIEQ